MSHLKFGEGFENRFFIDIKYKASFSIYLLKEPSNLGHLSSPD
jgi:hypothetical protein|tara:strand:+ start:2538 stop:2666 length:129 start_codon:yes stop_codon:yes gene_type:complete